MDVQHPAAKMLIEAAKTQDKEVGDGTTTVAVLAGELLKKAEVLLDQKVHPTMIVQGYRLAADRAIEIVKSMAVNAGEGDRALLEKIARTAMTGKLSESPDSKMSAYAVELVLNALETYNGKKKFDMDRVNVEKKVGESTADSAIIDGIAIDKEIVHQNMPRRVVNAKVALLSTPIESKDTETKTEVQITSSTQFQQFMEHEKARVKEAADKVIASGATVVFCQKASAKGKTC